MCNSKAMGGRRCAAHTFPTYKKHLEDCKVSSYPSPEQLQGLLRASISYASTPKGSVRISEDLSTYGGEEDLTGMKAVLEQSIERGAQNMAIYREKETQIKLLTGHVTMV